MVTRSFGLRLSTLLATVLVVSSCGATSTPPPATQQVCDGISADVGGCTTPRHTFTGRTCIDLAKEWAGVLDPALVAILDGPAVSQTNGRSVRLQQALVIATADMNIRLRDLNLQDGCDAPEFLAAAEPLFSSRLKSGIGDVLFDGNPVSTYDDWLGDVRRELRVIDDGESPGPSGSNVTPPSA